MLRVILLLCCAFLLAALGGCDSRISESKVIGAWSWTDSKGQGRIVFTADHTMKTGFEPEENPGRPLRDDDFTYVRSGTWRLEGDILVTETDNSPWIAWYDKIWRDGDHWNEKAAGRPKLEPTAERKKILHIDAEKMVFADGYHLERDHRVK